MVIYTVLHLPKIGEQIYLLPILWEDPFLLSSCAKPEAYDWALYYPEHFSYHMSSLGSASANKWLLVILSISTLPLSVLARELNKQCDSLKFRNTSKWR